MRASEIDVATIERVHAASTGGGITEALAGTMTGAYAGTQAGRAFGMAAYGQTPTPESMGISFASAFAGALASTSLSKGYQAATEANTAGEAAGRAAGKAASRASEATSRLMFEVETARLRAAIDVYNANSMLADGTVAMSTGQAALADAQALITKAAADLQALAARAAPVAARMLIRASLLGMVLSVPGDTPVMNQAKDAPEGYTDKIGKVANETGRSPQEIKEAIHDVKQNLGRGGPRRNPDVWVHPKTGDVRPQTPSGPGDSIGNIFDHLK